MKYLTIMISMLLLTACGTKHEAPEQQVEAPVESTLTLSAEQLKNAKLTIGRAEKSAIPTVVKLSGTIELPPQNLLNISSPLGGYLKSTRMLPGMPVKKGAVLAVMEDAQFVTLQQDYLIAQSNLALAEAALKRQEALNFGKAGSDKMLEQARNEFENQRITRMALAEKLRLIGIAPEKLTAENISRTINIYAPIQGFVSKVVTPTGKYVTPAEVLFELVNTDDLHLTLTAFEQDVTKLAIGQQVTAFTNGNPDKKYIASILLINKSLDATRAAEVHCHFDRPEAILMPGMFMNAEVAVPNEPAWVVPESAVVRWQNTSYIFLPAEGGQFDMQKVEAGSAINGKVAITAAIDLAGRQLVLENAYTLLMSLKNSASE